MLKPIAIRPQLEIEPPELPPTPDQDPDEAPGTAATTPKEVVRRPLLSQLFSSNRHHSQLPLGLDNLPEAPPSTEPIESTTIIATSTDNPNIIYPFPVPFLKKAPKISQASYQTLPPSIVVAHSGEIEQEKISFENKPKGKIEEGQKQEAERLERYEEFELKDDSFLEKKHQKQGK